MPLTGLPWRPNISNTSAMEVSQSASAAAQRSGAGLQPGAAQMPAESLKRLVSNLSNQAEGSSLQRSMPAGAPSMIPKSKSIWSRHVTFACLPYSSQTAGL